MIYFAIEFGKSVFDAVIKVNTFTNTVNARSEIKLRIIILINN